MCINFWCRFLGAARDVATPGGNWTRSACACPAARDAGPPAARQCRGASDQTVLGSECAWLQNGGRRQHPFTLRVYLFLTQSSCSAPATGTRYARRSFRISFAASAHNSPTAGEFSSSAPAPSHILLLSLGANSSPGRYYNAYCSMTDTGYIWTQLALGTVER